MTMLDSIKLLKDVVVNGSENGFEFYAAGYRYFIDFKKQVVYVESMTCSEEIRLDQQPFDRDEEYVDLFLTVMEAVRECVRGPAFVVMHYMTTEQEAMTLNDFDFLLAMIPSLKATGQTQAYGLVWRYVPDQASPHLAAEAGEVAIVARPHWRIGRWTYAAAGGQGSFRRVSGEAPSLRHALEAISEMFPELLPHLRGIKVDRVWVGGKGYVWVEETEK